MLIWFTKTESVFSKIPFNTMTSNPIDSNTRIPSDWSIDFFQSESIHLSDSADSVGLIDSIQSDQIHSNDDPIKNPIDFIMIYSSIGLIQLILPINPSNCVSPIKFIQSYSILCHSMNPSDWCYQLYQINFFRSMLSGRPIQLLPIDYIRGYFQISSMINLSISFIPFDDIQSNQSIHLSIALTDFLYQFHSLLKIRPNQLLPIDSIWRYFQPVRAMIEFIKSIPWLILSDKSIWFGQF